MSIFAIFVDSSLLPRLIPAFSEKDAIARLKKADPELPAVADLDVRRLTPLEVVVYRDFSDELDAIASEDLCGEAW